MEMSKKINEEEGSMARYKCSICNYIYDEDIEGVKFEELPDDWKCPVCFSPKALFEKIEDKQEKQEEKSEKSYEDSEEAISPETPERIKEAVTKIHSVIKTAKSEISAMGTTKPIISWDEILVLGAQLNPSPLLQTEDVNLTTIIGKNAKKPMVIDLPVYVSHMSFGALSKESKIALAKGSSKVRTAMCSGEGGILKEEQEAAYKYIFEYIPNKYSVTDENLRNADAIEIKIGQGTKPGMGGHLPGDKVTEEIAKIRGKNVGEDIISPSKFEEIRTKEDLKQLVDKLRDKSEGRPIGIKLAAGHIEDDLAFVCFAKPDFITIDGRGGATGASPTFLKDSTTVPTIFALYRAKKYLVENNMNIDLVITGGLYTANDFVKALAMGANAIAVATAAMIALGCDQYRVCNTGMCPKGIGTQDPELRKRLSVEKASEKVSNYFKNVKSELEIFGRITGHRDRHELSVRDIVTTSREISENTNIKHA